MPKHVSESVDATITATIEFTTGTCKVSTAGALEVDVIAENTTGAGVTIDGVELKDFNVDATGVTATTVSATTVGATNVIMTGHVKSLTAGEDVVTGNVCYVKADGKLWKSNAGATTTMPVFAMATENISADGSGYFAVEGWFSTTGLTPGELFYASKTGGAVTDTAPSVSGDQVQIVGIAVTSTLLYFRPDYTVVEIA